MSEIFSQVRETCNLVAENARWVMVDYDRVLMYPERILTGRPTSLSHSAEHHYLEKGDDTLKFFIILDTLNFGSGYFPFLAKEAGFSGYYTVATKLTNHVRASGIPSPDELAGMDAKACARLFEQSLDNPHMAELMHYFASALSDLGRWISSENNGDYLGFLKSASSAADAVTRLTEMPFFRDASDYFGQRVWFLKRAQIMLQDIKIAAPSHKLIQFDDIDRMTIFADNLLPFVFRVDGLMTCHPWLEERINNGELIGSGSIEEIELRACSVHIAELICKVIREEYQPISSRELDYLLWMRGQRLKATTTLKRHRTRCPYY